MHTGRSDKSLDLKSKPPTCKPNSLPPQSLPLVQPFPKRQILDSSKLKESADDNFKFEENGKKFFKLVENAVGKGEIAHYEQFLLFPQCFQKACTADT